jgi:hypothetical protein
MIDTCVIVWHTFFAINGIGDLVTAAQSRLWRVIAVMSLSQEAKEAAIADVEWDLRLDVAGSTPKSAGTFRNLMRLCEEHLAGRYRYRIEIV